VIFDIDIIGRARSAVSRRFPSSPPFHPFPPGFSREREKARTRGREQRRGEIPPCAAKSNASAAPSSRRNDLRLSLSLSLFLSPVLSFDLYGVARAMQRLFTAKPTASAVAKGPVRCGVLTPSYTRRPFRSRLGDAARVFDDGGRECALRALRPAGEWRS